MKEGELFRIETVDWTGGQIADNDSADDIKTVDLSQVHFLSGPIRWVQICLATDPDDNMVREKDFSGTRLCKSVAR